MGDLLKRLGMDLPLIQAPMAGTSTPALAAAVCEAGGLGSLGLGAAGVEGARKAIADTRALTSRPFNANFFCHRPAAKDEEKEQAWLARMVPLFARFGAVPPAALAEIYKSFAVDDAMMAMVLETRPAVVSFHFGLPSPDRIAAMKQAGIALFASATSLAEGLACQAAGIDAVVAQGWEAGGHRGMFDENAADEQLGILALTQLLARNLSVPVIAAGGIMDGAGIAAVLGLGAVAAQLGTAFIACPESAADAAYRVRLAAAEEVNTAMTRVISGRPARCLTNAFTAWGSGMHRKSVAAYPNAYDAGKALNAAARAEGEAGFGAQWAGQGAALSRAMPAGDLVRLLAAELAASRG